MYERLTARPRDPLGYVCRVPLATASIAQHLPMRRWTGCCIGLGSRTRRTHLPCFFFTRMAAGAMIGRGDAGSGTLHRSGLTQSGDRGRGIFKGSGRLGRRDMGCMATGMVGRTTGRRRTQLSGCFADANHLHNGCHGGNTESLARVSGVLSACRESASIIAIVGRAWGVVRLEVETGETGLDDYHARLTSARG